MALGVDPNIAIRVAFGTSLAVILPTTISGAWGHKRKGAVLIRPALIMGITGFIGGLLGALLATNTPVEVLRIIGDGDLHQCPVDAPDPFTSKKG